ncbi:FAD-dependent sensor of blue light [Roseinatronobacter thiooxidans]|uniref:FAD-dependent sensor of blue light n=1 Tax=Roseinatronobacter thiooxidans TaxID=121821 RepID=A0A2W7QZ74_9RHOB|nr:BLUF domain-containing protein [Roseinatronobacter thiooxidans]PZX47119.1 FAD-dependent sensor of blue light [Roseinatronobacter thiooxidans]
MSLYRIIYSSRPFGYDSSMLNGILMQARRANERDDITGALICREDIFLQLLEGPEDKVKDAVARIKRDDRHIEVRMHVEKHVSDRMFGQWAMLHDPVATWIWTQAEIDDDVIERATEEEVEGFFQRLRDEAEAV